MQGNFRFSCPGLVCLMGALALTLYLAPGRSAHAALHVVENCSDSGPGSLRAVVEAAANGDSIDLRRLSCGRVVLTSGQIEVPQDDLNLIGPGRFFLTIDGSQTSRVLSHSGTGTLFIYRLSIANGNHEVTSGFAHGGCLFSRGKLVLTRSRVHHCRLYAPELPDSSTIGGGIFAEGDVVLNYSSVSYNTALINAAGGGVYGRRVKMYRSQVYGNAADHGGGGIYSASVDLSYSLVHGNRALTGAGIRANSVTLNKSTVSSNYGWSPGFPDGSGSTGGGIMAGLRSLVVDSTISGNSARNYGAAWFRGDALIFNSTITNNADSQPPFVTSRCDSRGNLRALNLRLESSIVAGNRCGGVPSGDIAAGTSVTGSHNLVGSADLRLPADTISADPQLAPLDNNGGPVRTHLPLASSPVIDRGSNFLNRMYDQRGVGYPRVKGASSDIGAIER